MADKGKTKDFSKARQELLDKVMTLFNGKTLNWTKGWSQDGVPQAPVSAITGSRYRGVNNLVLWLTAMERGYKDNRWLTFNQIEKNGWHFKKDENGNSLGKGAGVPIELFRYYDKLTKKDVDFKEFGKLTLEEQKEYWKENVKIILRNHTVFNADVVDGIPTLETKHISADERDDAAEKVIRAWNDKQCKIIHDGGDSAYYSPKTDDIHLPEKSSFASLEDYYGTAAHEIAHSTGHASRLDRDLSGGFGSEKYAIEELRAEFSSLFIQQEIGLKPSDFHVKNHVAYLQNWGEIIGKDPKVLFGAVNDAAKITSFIMDNAAELQQENAAELENIADLAATQEGAEEAAAPISAGLAAMIGAAPYQPETYAEQTANVDSPFIRAMLGEDVSE